jgi:5-methylcytosine-specific restriction endonuclease McrA
MTVNTDTQTMTEVASEPEQTLTVDEDDPHIVWERHGGRCCICDEIIHHQFHEERGMLAYPLHPDFTPQNGIPICENCFTEHTDEQLDGYVEEMQERQQALEEDPGDYEQNRERAFERDDHTCQLCGKEGYPKTERGLVAYPVCAGDYHLDNLVTICNDCITDTLDSDEDDQKAADRLRLQAARAKEWVNSDQSDANSERTDQPENPEDCQ